MTRPVIAVVDVETTGLRADDQVWEVGLIVVQPDGKKAEYQWALEPDLSLADSTSLRMTHFYERLDGLPAWSDPEAFAREFATLTANAVLLGACTNFDANHIERILRTHGWAPAWNYHLLDIENIIAGWLGLEPPWNSTLIQEVMGIEVDEREKHTALGDARWAWRLYEAWLAQVAQRERERPVKVVSTGDVRVTPLSADGTPSGPTVTLPSGSSTASDAVAKPEIGASNEGTEPVEPQAAAPARKSRRKRQDDNAASVAASRAEAAEPAVESAGSAAAADSAPSDPGVAPTVEGAPAEHTQTLGATQTPPPEPVPADVADTSGASPAYKEDQPWGSAPDVIAAIVPKARAAAVVAPPAAPDDETETADPPQQRKMPDDPTKQFECEGGCGNLTELPRKPGGPSAAQVSFVRLRKYLCFDCTREQVGA